MAIRLTLIVHGETSVARRGTFPNDEGLESRGREAAAKQAGTLPRATKVHCSPARAARETASAMGLDAEVEPALADIDVGGWAGRAIMDIGAQDPESATAWIDDPAFAGHGGESFDALVARVGIWLEGRRATEGVVVAVTHAAVLRAAAISILGAPVDAIWRIEAPPLARLTLGSDSRRWTLRALNAP